MNFKLCQILCAVALIGSFSGAIALAAAPADGEIAEAAYIKKRDEFIQAFDEPSPKNDEKIRDALHQLEGMLRPIIGHVLKSGPNDQGKISLETLQKELGFGKIDGLQFNLPKETMVVTTSSLLRRYAKAHRMPDNIKDLANSDLYYAGSISSDAAISIYGEVPVEKKSSTSFAAAAIGLSAQDVGPFPPNSLLITVEKKNRIFIVIRYLDDEIPQIEVCHRLWEKKYADSKADLANARRSADKNKKNARSAVQREDEVFLKYKQCFGENLRREKSFAKMKALAQSIIDRIQAY